MNEVSRNLDHSRPVCTQPCGEILSELQAFTALDPLLADLNKQYLDAHETRAKAIAEFGADEGMSDMAAIMEDSAWCAVQTRYMELRRERTMMRCAQAMTEESRHEAEQRRKHSEQEKSRMFLRSMRIAAEAKKERAEEELLFLYWMWMFKTEQAPMFRPQATTRFNIAA